jgi:hypothetical protein
VVQEAWLFLGGPSSSELSLVSQHYNPYLVDTTVAPMQYLVDTTLIFGGDSFFDHFVSHLVQPVVVPMQYSTVTNPIFGVDASLELVVSHPIQPTIEEVVVLMQYLVDTTLLLESENYKEVIFLMQYSVNLTLLFGGDASFNHVLRIYIYVPSSQGSIPLSSSTHPPIPRIVSFDWNDIVESHLPSYTHF